MPERFDADDFTRDRDADPAADPAADASSLPPLPAPRKTPAAEYAPESMTRERATSIMIAFGLATKSKVPIERRMTRDGSGYLAVVPMEWIAGLTIVKKHLVGKPGKTG